MGAAGKHDVRLTERMETPADSHCAAEIGNQIAAYRPARAAHDVDRVCRRFRLANRAVEDKVIFDTDAGGKKAVFAVTLDAGVEIVKPENSLENSARELCEKGITNETECRRIFGN